MTWLKFYCPCCGVRYEFNSSLLRTYPICGYCDCPLQRVADQEEEDFPAEAPFWRNYDWNAG